MFKLIGHFRVPKTLTFKIRPSAQPFLWKWDLFAWEWKIISIRHLQISHDAPHLPPKICITFVFYFSWVLQPSQEKNAIFFFFLGGGGQIRCIVGDVQVTKGWAPNLALIQRPGGTRKWPMSWDLFLKSPVNFSGPESCFVFAAFASRIKVSAILKIILVIAIAMCQRAKILPIRARCLICLEMSWITVIYEK